MSICVFIYIKIYVFSGSYLKQYLKLFNINKILNETSIVKWVPFTFLSDSGDMDGRDYQRLLVAIS